jgi:hypothetical protein
MKEEIAFEIMKQLKKAGHACTMTDQPKTCVILKDEPVAIVGAKGMTPEGVKAAVDIIRNALASAAAGANAEFAKLPDTLEQQQARLQNAWKSALAGLDSQLKTSEVWKFFNRTITEGLENIGQRFKAADLLGGAEVDEEIRRLETRLVGLRQQAAAAANASRGDLRGITSEREILKSIVAIEERLIELRTRGRALNFEAIEDVPARVVITDAAAVQKALDTPFTTVPYRGTGPAMADLLSGTVSMALDTLSILLPPSQAGSLRALGVTTPQRSRLVPDLPALAEALPGFKAWARRRMTAGSSAPDT